MTLSDQDIAELQASKPIFTHDPDAAAGLFYARLFEIAPELRAIFPADLGPQGRKLVAAIALVVDTVTDWDRLGPVLTDLARRHVGYGVRPTHYSIVGRALLDTLETAGASAEQRQAWARAYGIVSAYMIAQSTVDARAAHAPRPVAAR